MEKNYFNSIINDIFNISIVRIMLKDSVNGLINVQKSQLNYVNIYIDLNYYNQNKEVVENFVCNLIKNNNINVLDIADKQLVTDNIKNEIIKSNTIKNLKLGFNPYNPYNFTYDDYMKFMKSNLTLVESPTTDEKLKKQSGYEEEYNIFSFNPSNLIIDRVLSEEQINDVINQYTKKITFTDKGLECFDKIINRLGELNLGIEVIVMVKNKNKFNNILFNKYPSYQNINVKVYDRLDYKNEMSLNKYFSYEKLLYQMVEPAKDLSPFEKYVYAYNITKLFKKYKDDESDIDAPRNLYRILDNEYIVCAGYANLFCDLLDKLGIENHYLKEAININEERSWHARTYSHIVDEKYGIDGFYRSDPTWDSKIENYFTNVEYDYYNHMVMTETEATNCKTLYIDLKSSNELFNISSLEEFYNKINFLIKKTRFNLKYLCEDIIYRLERLDRKYVEYLKSKYNFIDQDTWPKDLNSLVNELGNYILTKVNNPISLDKIMQAVEVVYRHSYGYEKNFTEEDLNDLMETVRDMNKYKYSNIDSEENLNGIKKY